MATPTLRLFIIHRQLCNTLHGRSNKETTKCLAMFCSKLVMERFKNLKIGHVTLATSPLGVIHHPICRPSTCHGGSNKEKRSVQRLPFKCYGGSHNLKSRSRDSSHAHLGVIHHSSSVVYRTRHGRSNEEKTKCLASSVQKLQGPTGVPKI